MKKNIGTLDRILRILAGSALIGWALLGGPLWAWIGILPLLTGIIRICPAYLPLGISTGCKSGCQKP